MMSPRKKVRCCHFDVKKLKILLKKCWLHGIIRTMKTIAKHLVLHNILNIITLTEQDKQQGGSLWSLSSAY
ncbi:hypothetical protein J41TS2_22770 [Bacillus sonorensis]|nr:hypothetical protein J41TS2_22770 [Bacillus sonorensis]